MDEELTVYTGGFQEFISAILKPDHRLTRMELEQAGQMFRACGSGRRYIAYAICEEYKPVNLTVSDRESLTALCREYLHCSMDYALRLHRQAKVEMEIWGPLDLTPERLSQSMSLEYAEILYKLPEGKRKEAWEECVSFHQINGGIILQSNLSGIVNRRIKELAPKAPAIESPPAEPKKESEVTPNFKPDKKKGAKAEQTASATTTEAPATTVEQETVKFTDDDEDPKNYDAAAVLATEAMVPILVTKATFAQLEALTERWKCETVEQYIEWEVGRLHAKHCQGL